MCHKPKLNQLDIKSVNIYKHEYINQIKNILGKYLEPADIEILNTSDSSWQRFFNDDSFKKKNIKIVDTNISFGKYNLKIPIEFEALMLAILKKDMKTKGIFRESQPFDYLNKTFDDFVVLIDSESRKNEIFDRCSQENICILTNLFSRLFTLYDKKLFPRRYLDLAIKLIHIEDENEKKLCFKALLLSLPELNRHLFESIAKFFTTVSHYNCLHAENIQESMSLASISTCVAPRVFMYKDEIVTHSRAIDCVNIFIFFVSNFEEMIKIDDIIYD